MEGDPHPFLLGMLQRQTHVCAGKFNLLPIEAVIDIVCHFCGGGKEPLYRVLKTVELINLAHSRAPALCNILANHPGLDLAAQRDHNVGGGGCGVVSPSRKRCGILIFIMLSSKNVKTNR